MENQLIKLDNNQLEIKKTQARTNYLNFIESKQNEITKLDYDILRVKYSSDKISELPETVLDEKISDLVLRISIITGWEILNGPLLIILIEEVKAALKLKYTDVNFDEILFAFREFGGSVNNWGKSLNINLFDKVMTPYFESRRLASETELKLKQSQVKELPGPEIPEEQILKSSFEYWKTSPMSRIEFLNPVCYDILERNKKINLSIEEKEQVKQKAITTINGYESSDREKRELKSDNSYMTVLCKKIALSEYFTNIESLN